MLASITPLGERGRNMRWSVTVAFYLLGSILGGTALGGAAGVAGWLRRDLFGTSLGGPLLAVAVLSVAALALDSGLAGRPVPTLHRQVNEDWLGRYRGWVYGLSFGVQLGLGLVTTVSSAAVYVVVALAFLSPSMLVALLIGSSFGLARALPVLLTASVATPSSLTLFHQRLASWRGGVRALTLILELSLGAAAALALAGTP